jgi:hydrogenase maturation protease
LKPSGWDALGGRAPRTVSVDGVEIGQGSRVRLRPRSKGDVFDLALAGQVGIVESLEQEVGGAVHLAVVLEDDPGRDLGTPRQPGHRFFFTCDEVEPLADSPPPHLGPRILVAGVGNVFLADDGFGVEVVRRLADRPQPAGVSVADFGIRGMDLAYELQEDYDAVVIVDAVPRGRAPGTLYVIEAELDPGERAMDTHGMDPVKVLALAQALGRVPERVLVVGCEPAVRMTGDEEDIVMELSAPVQASLDRAVELVESLLENVIEDEAQGEEGS